MSALGPSYHDLACWYDAIYEERGKDHAAEARALQALAEDVAGPVSSLLDVACGTGSHLVTFAESIDQVAGLDASPEMLAIASGRLAADVTLDEGDLRTFDLGRTFDVVTCLFSSIGHVADADELDAAIARMAAHVAPGGVLLVEPWLTPDRVQPGGVRDLVTATTEDGVIARAGSSREDGDALVLEFAWAVASPTGVATFEERLRMPLFTQARYLDAVERAGLTPSWRDQVPGLGDGRGLLIGLAARGDEAATPAAKGGR